MIIIILDVLSVEAFSIRKIYAQRYTTDRINKKYFLISHHKKDNNNKENIV